MIISSNEFLKLLESMPPASSSVLLSEFEGYLGSLSSQGQVEALRGASQAQVDQVWGVLKPSARKTILAQQWEEFVAKEIS